MYDQKLLKVIYNILQLCSVTDTKEEQRYMVDGLLSILVPTNEKNKNVDTRKSYVLK